MQSSYSPIRLKLPTKHQSIDFGVHNKLQLIWQKLRTIIIQQDTSKKVSDSCHQRSCLSKDNGGQIDQHISDKHDNDDCAEFWSIHTKHK